MEHILKINESSKGVQLASFFFNVSLFKKKKKPHSLVHILFFTKASEHSVGQEPGLSLTFLETTEFFHLCMTANELLKFSEPSSLS